MPVRSGARCESNEAAAPACQSRPLATQAWAGRDKDKYGRKQRVFMRDRRSLGDILVSEGLARTWTGRRLPWC